SFDALASCVLVVEAVVENEEIKAGVLRTAAGHAPADATLATNTSALSVSGLAEAAGVSGRLVGLHFMNPAPGSRLAELAVPAGVDTAHADRARACAEGLGLTVVETADTPGYAVNRALMPMIVQAARLVEEGGASAKAVDDALRLGCGHPMGPLALADFIGLDVVLEELETLEAAHGPAYAPPGILREHVAAGRLGRKTGEGFHSYGRRRTAD
ncbi:MAG: 3-hydroxyacyl-CoA dehydrogenase family protein, partial [Planctomycetota bacterium]